MKRMAGSDAVFLSAETPTWHQHVGGIVLLEPSDTFSYERIVDVVRHRIGALPRFTYKVKETPRGLDRPVWVDDPTFDVERHLIRAACPRPGPSCPTSTRSEGPPVGFLCDADLLPDPWALVEGLQPSLDEPLVAARARR
ncbi:MAG TPA: wax ester/triacylglycerol synthase domain-containing protein [Acidimicrobiales bacterium]|nr:wax ester/triacylglycerol synthase domain-containing protein [Acidimicrobiales bacterium]